MFDTISIRIKNLAIHNKLYEFLVRSDEGQGKTLLTTYEPETSKELHPVARLELIRRLYYDHDKDFTFTSSYKNKLTSSHYDLSYCINEQKDYISFDFSIPKYLYGTNVFQTLPLPWLDASLVSTLRGSGIESLANNYKYFWDFLNNFLNQFFTTQFGEIPIYKDLVEINRLDCCFNMYFPSYNDAIDYLGDCPKIAKKYTSKDKIMSHDQQDTISLARTSTGFEFRGTYYHQKIYHKGTEFKKSIDGNLSNRKNLMEKNFQYFVSLGYDHKTARKGELGYLMLATKTIKGLYDVNYLQATADRIIRFETSFKSSAFNEFFKKGSGKKSDYYFTPALFRKNCPVWTKFMKVYKTINANIVKQKQREKAISEQKKETLSFLYKNNMMGKIEETEKLYSEKLKALENWKNDFTPKQFSIFGHVEKVLLRRNKFHLAITGNSSHYDAYNQYDPEKAKKYEFSHNYDSLFSKEIVKICIEKFVSFVKEFEIKDRDHINQVLKSIDLDIKQAKKDNKIIGCLKNMGLDEIKPLKSVLRKSTFKKYIHLLDSYDWDLNELKSSGNLAKSTYYDMIKMLKKYDLHKGLRNETAKFVMDYSVNPYYYDLHINNKKIMTLQKPIMTVFFENKNLNPLKMKKH
jgi:hypothetical protein